MSTQNPTPDATATPRTDQDRINSLVAIGIDATEAAQLVELAKPAIKMQEELAAAKAEIARLQELNSQCAKDGIGHAHRAERAEAQLRERTQWQCKCGGTDCAGQAENERLRAEVERERALRQQYQEANLAANQRWNDNHAQLRARVADLELALRLAGAESHKVRELAARAGKGAT